MSESVQGSSFNKRWLNVQLRIDQLGTKETSIDITGFERFSQLQGAIKSSFSASLNSVDIDTIKLFDQQDKELDDLDEIQNLPDDNGGTVASL